MNPVKRTNNSIYVLSVGSLLLTLGGCLLILWPWIMDYLMNYILSLHTKTTFDLWKKNPMPLTLDIYIFNWTNPEDIYNPNTKPIFEEIGPFVFEETKEKVNLTWNNNKTITFAHLRHWYFDETRSVANLSTEVVTINAIAVAAGYALRNWNFIMKRGFDFSLQSMSVEIYKKTTVGEMLFEGYSDPLIQIGKALPAINNLELPPMDKFGWFYTRNGSSTFDGIFNMVDSGEKFGNTEEWNFENRTKYYDDECGNVRGSAGEFYQPHLQKTQIGFFSPDICRYVPLDFEEEATVDGITGYKFILGPSFLDNGTSVSGNKCFVRGENVPSGTFNVSSCRYGSPAFVSQPHFYGADPYYNSSVEGLNPTKEKHEMFMTLEPKTAIPLQVAARLQLNVLMQPDKHISILNGIPKVFMPVIWFEQTATIPDKYSTLLSLFIKAPMILQWLGGITILFSIAMIIFVIFKPLLLKSRYHAISQKNYLSDRKICTTSKDKEMSLLS